ncbi:MAG: MBL fold metallo-hydrolase [Desulfurococcales archaeon]|nr:MBL fold metallo-hydrolase [Desulfurococcales archaeon]
MARVTLLVGDRRGRFPGSNCLIIKGAKNAVLIDAGCKREQVESARNHVDAVLYTHIHPDHITHHELLRGKPVIAPAADAAYESLEALAQRYAPEAWREWLRYVDTVFGLRSVPRADRAYEPWEEVRVGDVSIETIPAPGHTQGHTLLIIDGHLHLSDIDLTSFGPWYGHPESSITQFISDIAAARAVRAALATTSHRERAFTPEELDQELDRYLRALCRQAQEVHAALRRSGPAKPRSLAGAGVIYKKYIPGMEEIMRYFERMMIWKLLDHLTLVGAAKRTGRGLYEAGQPPDCTQIAGHTI